MLFGMFITAYGPLGRRGLRGNPNDPLLMEDTALKQLALKVAVQILSNSIALFGRILCSMYCTSAFFNGHTNRTWLLFHCYSVYLDDAVMV